MSRNITTPDYELFKHRQYDLLLEKYHPLISKVSMKFIQLNDSAIDFEDIYQENMIVAWRAIEYIQKRIKQKTTVLNDKLYFGIILKQRLLKYSKDRFAKLSTKINQNLNSLSNVNIIDLKELIVSDNTNVAEQVEYKLLSESFLNQLTSKERNLILLLEQFKTCNAVANKTKVPYHQVSSAAHKLKCKCKDFIIQQGYRL
jgi:DNA-directed RNA polymerase specialized sigma24 family protein